MQVYQALALAQTQQNYQLMPTEAKRTFLQEKHWRETILEKEQGLKTKADKQSAAKIKSLCVLFSVTKLRLFGLDNNIASVFNVGIQISSLCCI